MRSAQRITINIEEYRTGSAQRTTINIEEYRTGSAQRTTINIEEYRDQIGTAFHSEYRSIQTKVNKAAHTTTKNSFRAQRGGSAREGVRATEL